MRKPDTIERLYLDFDGFFASVEQQARPELRGRPVGIVPFTGTDRTCVIAASREAKAFGVKNVMNVAEARALCPDLMLVPQSPDLYRRAHNTLLAEIAAVIPIDAVKSIDELTCRMDAAQASAPQDLARRIKSRIREHVGRFITCSIGFAANRQLAKMAGKMDKPDGVTVWAPEAMPAPLMALKLSDIPGVGGRMEARLSRAGIQDVPTLYATQPKQMRKLWGNVTGERLWYALHGYDVQVGETSRGMFGHGRILPPEGRTLAYARDMARLLLIKAARRLRRGGYYAEGLWVWMDTKDGNWSHTRRLPVVQDDQAVLAALEAVWAQASAELPGRLRIFRIGVALCELSPADARQLDFLLDDDRVRQRWEKATIATDALNARYGATVVSLGMWKPPPGGHAGGKISYTRIPSAEDFW